MLLILTETYAIEDCDVYDTTTHSTESTVNISLSTPNKATVEFDITKSQSNSGALIQIGDNANNCLQVGLLGSENYGFIVKHSGSVVTTQQTGSLSNGTYHCELTYDNGSITCKINNVTKTYTYTQPLTKLISYNPWNNGSIKNMKIKAL